MDKESIQSLVVGLLIMGFIVVGSGMSFLVREEKETPPKPATKTVSVEDTASIDISAKGFVPATLSVKSGTLVTFTNKDKKAHQPASDPHPAHDSLPGFDSQTKLQKGQSYSFLFDKEGTFTYHDHLNPLTFNGSIIVGK
jgi:plastocyanin